MKILLVSPPYKYMSNYYFPVGIAYVSAALKQQGFNVVCHNSALDKDWQAEFLRLLTRERPDILGVGALTPTYSHVKWMFEVAKKELPGVITMLGGGIFSSEPDVFGPIGADIGVLGEGEEVTVEVARILEQGGSLSQVVGIVYRDASGEIVNTGVRPFIEDLDSVPFPDFEGFNFRECIKHIGTYDMVSSRGCPFHCTFCYSALGRGRYRARSIDNVIAEIRHLVETYDLKCVGLMDEVFALKKDRILEFCGKVKEFGIAWYAQVRCGVVDLELLKSMREAGCQTVFYGLESMSPTVLESMNKKLKPEQIEAALEMTYQARMDNFGNFIFGDPAETVETAWQTLEWWMAHRKYFVNLGKIDCWPGTKIYHQMVERGVVKDKIAFIEAGCPLINMTSMPDDEFMELIRCMWLLHEGVLFPAELLSAGMDDGKGAHAEVVCPHCSTRQELTHLENVSLHFDRKAHRVPCLECGRVFDLPLRLPQVSHGAEVQRLFTQAVKEHAAGRPDEAMKHLLELFKTTREHPAAVALATSIRLAQGKPLHAREVSRMAVKPNPTSPSVLEWTGAAYAACGDARMGRIFREQAALLRSCRAKALEGGRATVLDQLEAVAEALLPQGPPWPQLAPGQEPPRP